MSQLYRQAHYTLSATQLSELPADNGIEVAFAGRSNAGKSSAINTITDQKSLARTSKTPGRTQMINFFEQMKIRWQQNLGKYLNTRNALKGLLIMMDIRHPLKEFDVQMVRWANESRLPVHILLTKSDKLKNGAAKASLHKVNADLKNQELNATAQLFSSLKRTGKEEAIAVLDSWFYPEASHIE
jgi:GTP-binding protein